MVAADFLLSGQGKRRRKRCQDCFRPHDPSRGTRPRRGAGGNSTCKGAAWACRSFFGTAGCSVRSRSQTVQTWTCKCQLCRLRWRRARSVIGSERQGQCAARPRLIFEGPGQCSSSAGPAGAGPDRPLHGAQHVAEDAKPWGTAPGLALQPSRVDPRRRHRLPYRVHGLRGATPVGLRDRRIASHGPMDSANRRRHSGHRRLDAVLPPEVHLDGQGIGLTFKKQGNRGRGREVTSARSCSGVRRAGPDRIAERARDQAPSPRHPGTSPAAGRRSAGTAPGSRKIRVCFHPAPPVHGPGPPAGRPSASPFPGR